MKNTRKSAFTLVEIMIVVIIIGLLASMAMPAFIRSRERAQNTRLANDLRVLAGIIDTYSLEQGVFPSGGSPGQLPSGLGEYIKADNWTVQPSIGGSWDMENNSNGVVSAVGVSGYTVTEEQIAKFDSTYDDGNISTGVYRKLGSGYYAVVAD